MRSDFSSSSLVRLLDVWSPTDRAERDAPGMDFAERLSLWLNAFDAIGLQAAHQSIRTMTAAAPAQAPGKSPARPGPLAEQLREDLRRVRSTLARAIAQELPPPLNLPGHPRLAAQPSEQGYGPYRQRHQELQRRMEQMLAPLRDHVRETVAATSTRLRQLAALDAALEPVIGAREQALLPASAELMQRHYEQLRQTQPDDPDWLPAFERDWRQALLAELDLRLQPVAGLIDALAGDPTELKTSQ